MPRSAPITAYENGLRFSPEGELHVETHGDWTIYAAPFLRNGMRQSNCVLVDGGKYIYRLKITGGFRSDYLHFLEEIRIEGKKLHIEYAEDRLEDIRLTD